MVLSSFTSVEPRWPLALRCELTLALLLPRGVCDVRALRGSLGMGDVMVARREGRLADAGQPSSYSAILLELANFWQP